MKHYFTLSEDLILTPVEEFDYFTQNSVGTQFLTVKPDGWTLGEGETLSVAFERVDGTMKLDPILMGKAREWNIYFTIMPTEVMLNDGAWKMCIYKRLNYNSNTGMADVQEVGETFTFDVVRTITDDSGNAVTKYDLANLMQFQRDIENGLYAARGLYPWTEGFVYGKNELAFYAQITGRELGAFVRSKVDENIYVPYDENGNLDSTHWEEMVNFNNVTEKFWSEINSLVEGVEETVDAAIAARDLAEEYANRARNVVGELNDYTHNLLKYVTELPDISEAEERRIYAVVTDASRNIFTLFVVENGSWRMIGGANIMANGQREYVFTLTRGSANWVSNIQTVTIPEWDKDFYVELYPDKESAAVYVNCGVRAILDQNTGQITFACRTVPNVNLAVVVKVRIEFNLETPEYYTVTQTEDRLTAERNLRVTAEAELDGKISQTNSDVDSLREAFISEQHHRGYVEKNADVLALSGNENDYAWSAESGTVWIFGAYGTEGAVGWHDSGKKIPNQTVLPATMSPLMDGKAAVGSSKKYAPEDHRHPTDTTRASAADLSEETQAREAGDAALDGRITANSGRLDQIVDGTTVVGKAEADEDGNRIKDTYARKDEIPQGGGSTGGTGLNIVSLSENADGTLSLFTSEQGGGAQVVAVTYNPDGTASLLVLREQG